MVQSSIIIPVYNNWDYTRNCLDSILMHAGEGPVSFEVIVVDDDSEDGTADRIKDYLDTIPAIRYVKNETNLGFAKTCNHGAAVARGHYLVFLNNDTLVTHGWLDQLEATISKSRDIWAVGAKCIYPDGTIQHAGVTFSDYYQYGLHHIYRDVPSAFPLCNYEKDYQCVTGACFIIRKEDFDSLNGFDESFVNSFEDVDLCLRIIDLGKRIIYQPSCQIIHHESKSDGRFDNEQLNMKILLDKWFGKIRVDETDHYERDLRHAVGTKALKLLAAYDPQSLDPRFSMWGSCQVNKQHETVLRTSDSACRILIRDLDPPERSYLLVAGELMAKSVGFAHLKYMTGQEKYYSDEKSISKKIYAGRNIFYFTIYASCLYGDLVIELEKFSRDTRLLDLKVYSFKDKQTRPAPSVAILYQLGSGLSAFQEFISSLDQCIEKVEIKMLIACDDREMTEEAFAALPKDRRFEYRHVHFEDLSREYNRFLGESWCTYAVSMNDTVDIGGEDVLRFVELMEINPGTGFLFKSDADFMGRSGEIDLLLSNQWAMDFNLRKQADIPIAFRIEAWKDAGGFDTRFHYYRNLDLVCTIASRGNWKGFGLQGLRIMSFVDSFPLPAEIKSGLEAVRAMFYSKHARFLVRELSRTIKARIGPVNNTYLNNRHKKPKKSVHSTLLGSIKTHVDHFIRLKILKRIP